MIPKTCNYDGEFRSDVLEWLDIEGFSRDMISTDGGVFSNGETVLAVVFESLLGKFKIWCQSEKISMSYTCSMGDADVSEVRSFITNALNTCNYVS